MRLSFVLMFLLLSSWLRIMAQGISITPHGTSPDSSAILDIKSTTQGILLPRMSSDDRDAIMNRAHGLIVFDITTNTFWYYTGTLWSDLAERIRVEQISVENKQSKSKINELIARI